LGLTVHGGLGVDIVDAGLGQLPARNFFAAPPRLISIER
jgi:hypothetical protein